MNENTKITLDIYIECLSHKVGKSSINLYRRLLNVLLKALKYKEGDSIVDYLKDYKKVQSTIEKLRQTTGKNAGELYSLGTKKLIYQAISTGLWKDTCPMFEKQIGEEAKRERIHMVLLTSFPSTLTKDEYKNYIEEITFEQA